TRQTGNIKQHGDANATYSKLIPFISQKPAASRNHQQRAKVIEHGHQVETLASFRSGRLRFGNQETIELLVERPVYQPFGVRLRENSLSCSSEYFRRRDKGLVHIGMLRHAAISFQAAYFPALSFANLFMTFSNLRVEFAQCLRQRSAANSIQATCPPEVLPNTQRWFVLPARSIS